MADKYLDILLNSLEQTLPQLGLEKPRKGKISNKEKYIESPDIIVIIGIIGDIKGNIVYGLSYDDGKKLASDMMMGMPVEEFNELAESAISELTNMITGSFATLLSQENINIDISTPSLIKGEFKVNSSTAKIQCIETIISEAVLEMNISLEKTR